MNDLKMGDMEEVFAFDTSDHHFSPPKTPERQVEAPKESPISSNESTTSSHSSVPWRSVDYVRGRVESPLREDTSSDGLPTPTTGNTTPLQTIPFRPKEVSPMRNTSIYSPIPRPTELSTASILKAERAARKKKKKAMKRADKALNIVRGFTPTPTPSGDEDSDCSMGTPNAISRVSSVAGSPYLRPSSSGSQGGISALRLKLDTLDLDAHNNKYPVERVRSSLLSHTPSVSGYASSAVSDGDVTPMETYEVPLEHDFVSSSAVPDSTPVSAPCKMTAADFEPLRCLGKGSFGTVILVRHIATGRLYAQKQLRKATLVVHKKLVEQTKTERIILESVNRHPFVVKLFYAFQDQEKLYLILEYAQGGELFTHLAMERMLKEDVAAFYMAELVLALDHLHNNLGVVYRDLKPENCLLDSEGHLLLTDFGLSKVSVSDDDSCKSFLGTIEYLAPEVVQGKNYGFAVDWWSLGALGFDLLTGSPPFQGNNHAKIQEKIVKQKLMLPYYLSPDAKDLLTRLLRKEPKKRLGGHTPKDLQAIKGHRFFRKINWAALEKRELEPPLKPVITDPELAENFSQEFTDMAFSPVGPVKVPGAEDPFGGFSFVASQSLLDWEMASDRS